MVIGVPIPVVNLMSMLRELFIIMHYNTTYILTLAYDYVIILEAPNG